MAIPPRVYQICVGIFASLGSFLYGYDLGVIGGSVAAAAFERNFDNPSDEIDGAIVAVFTGGGFFGAALAGLVSDMIGRRLTILLGAAIFLVGGALQTAGRDISYLLAGRAIAGLGVGDLVMIVPLYQAEIAHPAIRGRITALQQLLIGFGSMIASFTTYGTNQNMTADNNAQWRIPLGIQLAPAFLLACLILLFPESPRWQIAHGRTQKGLATLARLHASGNQDDEWVLAEYSQIEATIEQERAESASWMDLFKEKASFRRLFLVLALQASVQMTGVSAIQYFTPQIYASLNIGTTESLQYQAVSNVLAIVAQFCTAVFIDRIGRRWPLILGNVFNGIFWIVLTAVVAVFPSQPQSAQEGLGWVFIVMNWLFQLSQNAYTFEGRHRGNQHILKRTTSQLTSPKRQILLLHLRQLILDHSRRSLRHENPLQGRHAGGDDVLRLQHANRTSNRASLLRRLLALLHHLRGVQLHQRALLLGADAGDQEAAARGDECPLLRDPVVYPDGQDTESGFPY